MRLKPIKGYEDLYQISDTGEVWSNRKQKFLKKNIKRNGYYAVDLCKDNTKKTVSVHRLVAENFIENPLNLPVVNHKDECKLNNNYKNLEWCTTKYNNNYGKARSVKIHSVNQYTLDGKFVNNWESLQAAAMYLNLHYQCISACCRGIRKSSGGFKWSYAK